MINVKNKVRTLIEKRDKTRVEADEAEKELECTSLRVVEEEAKIADLLQKISILDDKLDETEIKTVTAQETLKSRSKIIEENALANAISETRITDDEDRQAKLEMELVELRTKNDEILEKLNILTDENAALDEQQDLLEDKCQMLDERKKKLEMEMTDLGNTLRLLQNNEAVASGRTTVTDRKKETVARKFDDAIAKAEKMEQRQKELDEDVTAAELERDAAEKDCKDVEDERNNALKEMMEI